MPTWIIWTWCIIAENHLGAGIAGVTPITQELCNVLDVLVASTELVRATGVIDANEEGLLPRHVLKLGHMRFADGKERQRQVRRVCSRGGGCGRSV
jgi:hypothetical protein